LLPQDAGPAVVPVNAREQARADDFYVIPAGQRRACVVGGNLNDLTRRSGGRSD
jgi:hypothetical protein